MTNLIVFDWDDVFTLGSQQGYFHCYQEAAASVGIDLDLEIVRSRVLPKWGHPVHDEVTDLLPDHPHLVDQAVAHYESIITTEAFTRHLTFIEGGRELLTSLAQKYTLAVASGSNPITLRQVIFPQFSVPNVFDQVVCSEDPPADMRGKPHPDMLLHIMKAQGASPEETLMVGDGHGDVHMAQAAGVTPVVVLTGVLNREEALQLGVNHIIGRVTDLPQLLREME
ncbi:MAG TPA: HAD family hydrolase [Verrucomicrobiae bacterium]|nr:HAD family hydrolase [Verrucomicrobiae bacterium]